MTENKMKPVESLLMALFNGANNCMFRFKYNEEADAFKITVHSAEDEIDNGFAIDRELAEVLSNQFLLMRLLMEAALRGGVIETSTGRPALKTPEGSEIVVLPSGQINETMQEASNPLEDIEQNLAQTFGGSWEVMPMNKEKGSWVHPPKVEPFNGQRFTITPHEMVMILHNIEGWQFKVKHAHKRYQKNLNKQRQAVNESVNNLDSGKHKDKPSEVHGDR